MPTPTVTQPSNNLPNLYANKQRKKFDDISDSPCLMDEDEDALKYALSLQLLSQVERRLRSHYRVGGKVCKTLDEAVNALLVVELS